MSTNKKSLKTVAAISDIHSNVFALDAVLLDIRKRNIDQIVNLGDILYGPIAPKATYELLMTHRENIITIRGNQDRQIFEATLADIHNNATLDFIVKELPSEAIEWMRHLPFDYRLNEDIYLCHGSPTDDTIYLLESVETGQPIVRKGEDILTLLHGIEHKVVLCGHTHIPRTVRLSTGQMIVNTGSVGYPAYEDELPFAHKMQTYSPQANYTILDYVENDKGGYWKTEHIDVNYDHEAAATFATKNGRTDWAFALRTGRVL